MIILQSSAFIVEIPKDTETTIASMVDKSSRITVTVTSPNRWHFSGKESQSFLYAKLLQKSEMRKDIVIELSYKGFG